MKGKILCVLVFLLSFFFVVLKSVNAVDSSSLKTDFLKAGIGERKPTSLSQSQAFKKTSSKEDRPDVVISFSLKDLSDDEKNRLLDELNKIKTDSKKFQYFYSNKLDVASIFGFGASDKLSYLKEKFPDLKISENKEKKLTYTPNDTYYSQQYNLTNINYSSAQDAGLGSTSVTVAVIDNGVNLSESDLTANLWNNSADTYGDSIDNDGNGYTDDYYGVAYYYTGSGVLYSVSPTDISDPSNHRHGTYTSSIIGAATNNSNGIASICRNCKIMALNAANYDSQVLYDDSVIYALDYAITKGAKVINMSFGSTCPFDSGSDTLAPYLNSVINTYGVMAVQAAGNNGSMSQSSCIATCGSGNTYCNSSARNDAYYYVDGKSVSNKINVASIGATNQRSSFSNYDISNSAVTIAAPGETIPVAGTTSFSSVNGTSFSAPHVSGAIGYLLSRILSYRTPSVSEIKTWLYNYGSKITTDYNISGKKVDLLPLITLSEAGEKVRGTDYLYVARFYSNSLGNHLWSGNAAEIQSIRDNEYLTRNYEGVAYYAFNKRVASSVPLYRFYRGDIAYHFFTSNETEKNNIIATESDIYNFEGTAYYVYPSSYSGTSTNVYRFYGSNTGKHLYTASESEKNNIINTQSNIWTYEGVAWKIPNL